METIEMFATKGIEYLVAIGFLLLFAFFWRLPVPKMSAAKGESSEPGDDPTKMFSKAEGGEIVIKGDGGGVKQAEDLAASTGIMAKTVQVLLVAFLVAPIVLFVVLLPMLFVVSLLTG